MRFIAFTLALVSFIMGLLAIVGGALFSNPWHGAVCTILGFGLTVFWLIVAERH